jgi:putative ABC transport system substrate-binding protein
MAIHIGRRELMAAFGGAAAWPLAANAQQPERMRRIGVLMSFGANDPEAQSRAAAFENGLRQLGWVRGHNLGIEYRWADNPDVLRTYATELVGMAPDLILVKSATVAVASSLVRLPRSPNWASSELLEEGLIFQQSPPTNALFC